MKRATVLFLLVAPIAAQDFPPAPVVVTPVVERSITSRRSFVGTVRAVRATTVGSQIGGPVVEYLVEEGQRVKKDQPLAKLRTRLSDIRLAAARSELNLRQQELAELEAGSRPEEIKQAQARLRQAQATIELRKWRLGKAAELFERKVIPEDEHRNAQLLMKVAEETFGEAQAAYELEVAGPRKEKIEQAKARVAVQDAEIDRLLDELARHTIVAPFNGYVVAKHGEVGEWLKQGDPVAEIVALDQVDAVVPVLEDFALGLRLQTKVPVTIGALPGRKFLGTLVAIVPRADARSHTFPVKVRIANPREGDRVLLKAGMFVTIHLPIGEARKALTVPKDALVLGGPAPIVYVVDAQSSKVRPVPVSIGIAVDGDVEVSGELVAGDLVVVRGNERLRPDQKVRITNKKGRG